MSQNILVLSATGNVGREVVKQLIHKGESVKAASRAGLDVEGASGTVLELTDPNTFDAALDDVKAAYMVLPPGYYFNSDHPIALLRKAAQRGIKIVLQTSTESLRDTTSAHQTGEQLVGELGVPFVILRPGWFMDNFHIFWLKDIKMGELALPVGESTSALIDVRDIASSAAAALTSDQFNGKSFNRTGPEAITYGKATYLLAKAVGSPVRFRSILRSEFIEGLVASGMPDASAEFFASALEAVKAGDASTTYSGVVELTGKRPRSFAEYAHHNAWRFQQ